MRNRGRGDQTKETKRDKIFAAERIVWQRYFADVNSQGHEE